VFVFYVSMRSRNQQKFGNTSGSVKLNCRGQCCFTKDVWEKEGRKRYWERGRGRGLDDGLMLQERGASSCHDCHVWVARLHHLTSHSLFSHLFLSLSLPMVTFFLFSFSFLTYTSLFLFAIPLWLFEMLLFHFLMSGERQP